MIKFDSLPEDFMRPIMTWILITLSSLFPVVQNPPAANSSQFDSEKISDNAFPEDVEGVLIKAADWTPISQSAPRKNKTKRGFASAFSYGAVPASVVSEYQGLHASIQVSVPRPLICVCRSPIPSTEILLVKLRVKKDSRELNGGRLPPFGAKVAEARQSDVIPIEASSPEEGVWLVRPRTPLPEGEYALMLGRQNIAIFPFGVSSLATAKQPATSNK